MTAISLDLPDALVQQADQAARPIQRALEQGLAAILKAASPTSGGRPPEFRTRRLVWSTVFSVSEVIA
jgi:hypothetical protein